MPPRASMVPAEGYTQPMDVRPWPVLHDEDRWLADTMDRRLRDSTQSAEQLALASA